MLPVHVLSQMTDDVTLHTHDPMEILCCGVYPYYLKSFGPRYTSPQGTSNQTQEQFFDTVMQRNVFNFESL